MGEEVKREMKEILDSFLKEFQVKIDNLLPQFESFNSSVLNKSREIEYLNEELEKADEKIEKLNLEIERLKNGKPETSERDLFDFNRLGYSKSEILKYMRFMIK